MEEILSSIRRIIADEDGGKAAKGQAAKGQAARPADAAVAKPSAAAPEAEKPTAATSSPPATPAPDAAPAKPAGTAGQKPAPASAQQPRSVPRPSEALAPAARQTQAATEKALDEIGAMVASGLTRIVAQQADATPGTDADTAAAAAPLSDASVPEKPTTEKPKAEEPKAEGPKAEGPAPLDLSRPADTPGDVGDETVPPARPQPAAGAEAGEVVFRDAGADVLELTQVVLPDGSVADARGSRAAEGLPAAVAEAAAMPRARVTLASAEPDPNVLSAPRTEERLYRERAPRPEADDDALAGDALERAMLRLLKPMLRQWMDENLEGIVERIVREELRRRP